MKKSEASIFQPGVAESLVQELMSGKSLPEVMVPLIKRILEAGLEGGDDPSPFPRTDGRGRKQPPQRQGNQTASQRIRSDRDFTKP
jgi:hypothetical protein